jgi:uncharacterized protein YbjT (DUF2867 family)
MAVVAVPGGSSPGLGRSIVKALLESGRHTPIVLSRLSSETPKWLTDLGVEVRKVDYTRVDSLVKGLVDVHTVSCLYAFINSALILISRSYVRSWLKTAHGSLHR